MPVTFLSTGPENGEPVLLLAHGAGAPMDSEFMNVVAAAIGERGVRVLRFEFPYMRARRESGARKPPDREAVLLETWRETVRVCGSERPFIGGKSMGGRMASMVADEVGAAGLVCLGYPFHPPGNREKLRVAHLERLQTRTLIVQGTNDPFGTREDVAGYALSEAIAFAWIEGGNHDLAAKGTPRRAGWTAIGERVAAFVRG